MALADILEQEKDGVFAANAKDLEAAKANNLTGPKMKRLEITPKVLDYMIQGCKEIAAMDDPVGAIDSMTKRPNGMLVGKMRIPLGVVAMIFESRPNVTVDSAILALMAGNAVILRGGSEAFHSNTFLAGLIHKALASKGLPAMAVQVLPTTDREAVKPHAQDGRIHRRGHPQGRGGAYPRCRGAGYNARTQALQRRMPHLCGRLR